MSLARHCDGPDCDTWQRVGSRLPDDFLNVTGWDAADGLHFCSWDCLLKYAAKREPAEVIDL